jgi:hypothetical protein
MRAIGREANLSVVSQIPTRRVSYQDGNREHGFQIDKQINFPRVPWVGPSIAEGNTGKIRSICTGFRYRTMFLRRLASKSLYWCIPAWLVQRRKGSRTLSLFPKSSRNRNPWSRAFGNETYARRPWVGEDFAGDGQRGLGGRKSELPGKGLVECHAPACLVFCVDGFYLF